MSKLSEKIQKEQEAEENFIPHYELNLEIDKLKGITYFHPDMLEKANL
jgi:hypothetical protein